MIFAREREREKWKERGIVRRERERKIVWPKF